MNTLLIIAAILAVLVAGWYWTRKEATSGRWSGPSRPGPGDDREYKQR